MMLLALGLSFSGFAALSLAMEKHQQELHGAQAAPAARRRVWRMVGWALLVAAFAVTTAAQGWAVGPVLWLGAMTVAGILLAFGLYPYRPRWIAAVAWTLPLAGLAAAFL